MSPEPAAAARRRYVGLTPFRGGVPGLEGRILVLRITDLHGLGGS